MRYRDVRVLVTGADGFIGSHLVEELAKAGARITALAQYDAFGRNGWLDDLSDDVLAMTEIVRGDVRDAGFVQRLVAGQEIVFHLAALIAIPHSYDAPHSYVDVNVTGTLNVLDAARTHGASRIVHTSTSEVYGTALTRPISEDHPLHGQSPYSASKIGADMMAEAYARSFGLPVSILRPFNTFGPRQSERAVLPTMIRQALDPECETIRLGDLTPTRDFNYVTNTVSAFLDLGENDAVEYGIPYNAGSGMEVSIGEVAERVRRLTGVNKPIEQEVERMRPEHSEVRALIANSKRLTDATGWAAEIDLDEGLTHTINWWRERVQDGKTRRGINYLR